MHQLHGLDFDTLIGRFLAEMGHVVGDPKRVRLSFVVLIEELYGELKGIEARRRITAAT